MLMGTFEEKEKTIKYYGVVHLFRINVNMCSLRFRLGKILFDMFVSLNTLILDDLVSFHNPSLLFYFIFIYFFRVICEPFERGWNSIKAIGRNKETNP